MTSELILTRDGQVVEPIQPTLMNIFLAASANTLNRLFVTIYSLLKYSKSILNIYVMTEVGEDEIEATKEKFSSLFCDRLRLTILPTTLLNKVVSRLTLTFELTALTYSKMLIPTLLPNLDRVLYLDYDTITIKEGIEWLYNINFKDKYLAVSDGTISCNKKLACTMVFNEHKIFETFGDFYFNNGVVLYNIPKIIADGKDKEMIEILKNPPTSLNNKELADIRQAINYNGVLHFYIRDNSFMNWIFRENDVIRVNKIFNSEEDNLYSTNFERCSYLKNVWKFNNYLDYFNNIVIAHYCGPAKPWYNRLGNISKYQNSLFEKYNDMLREFRETLE